MAPESPAQRPDRRSRLADDGTFLVHGDLHNHSMLSDGAGDPERAFAQMRAAGLDVAALTDHASIPRHQLESLRQEDYPDEAALALARLAPHSLDAQAWERSERLADDADAPGEFTAIRGFEWTEPWLGHANVWFSRSMLHVTTPGRISGLHEFLRDEEPDALFGYNHPGREPGRFGDFAHEAGLASRMVSLEAFNRDDDYLFEGVDKGRPSPLLEALAAGWRPGLIGVSDEHSRSYGLTGKGRTGLWVHELSRDGVRAALLARRTFATRQAGLRLDATLDGVRMGAELPALRGPRHLRVDLGGALDGRSVELQLLGPAADGIPAVLQRLDARIGELVEVDVTLPADAPSWVLLRVADPARRNATPGPARHPANAYGLAYASPWYAG